MISESDLIARRAQYLVALCDSSHNFPPAIEQEAPPKEEGLKPPPVVEKAPFDIKGSNLVIIDSIPFTVSPDHKPRNTEQPKESGQDLSTSLIDPMPFRRGLSRSIFEFLSTHMSKRQHFYFTWQWSTNDKRFVIMSDSVNLINQQQATNWFNTSDYLSFRWTYSRLLELVNNLITEDLRGKKSNKKGDDHLCQRWRWEVNRWKAWLKRIRKIDHPYQEESWQGDLKLSQLELGFYPQAGGIIDSRHLESADLAKLVPSTVLLNPALSALEHWLDGKVKIAVCKIEGCRRFFVKSRKRVYCSDECGRQSKRVVDGKLAPNVTDAIVAQLKELAHDQRAETAESIYQYLTTKAPALFPRKVKGGYTIGNWLRDETRLEELYGLTYTISRTKEIPNRNTYNFQLIQP